MSTQFATSPDSTSASLLLQVQDTQNQKAWKKFVDLYMPLVYRYCQRCGLQEADIRDVTQEVFTRVARVMRTFQYDRKRGRFRNWLGTIVLNEVRRHQKRQGRRDQAIGGTAEVCSTQATADADALWIEEFNQHVHEIATQQIRHEFAEDVWRAFELVWREDQPSQKVAQKLGRSPGWVYKAKFQVIQRLKREIEFLAMDEPVLQDLLR